MGRGARGCSGIRNEVEEQERRGVWKGSDRRRRRRGGARGGEAKKEAEEEVEQEEEEWDG